MPVPTDFTDFAKTSKERAQQTDWVSEYNEIVQTQDCPKIFSVEAVVPTTVNWMAPTIVTPQLILKISVGGERPDDHSPVWGVIDTGAESSLVSYQYVLDHDIPISTTTLTMRTMAKGDPKLRFIGACHVPVWINNYKIMTTMMVVDPETVNHDLLLGLPFAVSAELTFKYSKRFVTAVMKAKDCRSGKFRKISIPVGLMRSDSLRQIQRHFPEWESYMKDVHNTSEAAQGQPKTDQDLGDTYDEVRTCYVNATMDYEKERLLAQERKEADLLEQKEAVSKTDQCSTPISPLAALDVLGTIAKAAVTPIMETIQACLLGNTKSQQNLPKVPKDWAFFESIRKDPKPDQGFISIYTMYKRKDKKVHPVDNLPSDGSVPDGQKDWKKILTREVEGYYQLSDSPFASYVHPRFAQFDRGTRLTPERFLKLKVAWPHLLPREIEMLEYILTNREGALAWDFTECGRVDPRVAPPQKIRTVPHVAWQEKGIPIPKALQGKVIDMLRSRVARGVLEESHGSYRNSWFLVAKKDGNMRLINSCTKLNKISIRDAFIPPGADEFSEDFADCEIMSLLDLFSGYDQVSLDESSRDLTTFATPLGLFRMCTLPQGATNSVAQFMRVVTRILYDLIPSVCRPFLDDIPVRGPRTTYNGDHVVELPGVRLYVFEHFMNLDTVLWNLELAGATISPEKSQICQPAVNLLGYVVGSGGRKPDQNKVIKILEWEKCDDVTAVKSLLGIVGFYRAWIKDCGTISAPLIRLLRKGVPFEWGLEQQLAMETLKLCLVSPPLLRPIDYEEEAGEIYLSTDASTKGWGAVLGQYYQGKRCVARYESGIWTGAALNYDAGKLELRSVLLALKRLRNYLYGVRFTLETDAKVLVDQISGAASDLPGAVLTRWITWIKMFDFDIRHVPGTKNGAADGLSRKPAGESDIQEAEQDEDLDEMIDNSIYVLEAEEDPRPRADDLLNPEQAWSRRSRQIAEYLASLSRPRTVSWINFKKFKLRAAKYVLRDGFLFQKGTKSNPTPRRVVDDEEEQKKLIWHAHTEGGHRGRDATYARLRERYAWENMYRMTSDAIKGCLPCAQARPRRFEDPHTFSTPPGIPFQHIYVDVQKIGNYSLAEARDALTGYVEARQLPKNVNSRMMAKFIWEDVICRHGIYGLLTVDGGPENKGFVKKLNRVYGGRRLVISAYNSKANGLVEKGHQPLIHALMTWSDFGRKNWTSVLHTALFADRTSVRSSTGYSPFYLVYGYNPITPIETKSVTWRVLDWSKVRDAETELLFRIRTFEQLDSDRQTALEYVAKRRRQVAEDYNRRNKYRMRHKELQVGDIVLVYDARLSIDKSSSGKLSARWLGPFRIRQISPRTSSYLLETLAGIPIERTVAGDRLKKFVVNEDGHLDDISEMEVRPDLEQALNKVFPAANQPDPDAPSPADILDPDELSALEEAETDDFNAMKAQIEQLQEQNKTLQAEVDAWQKKNEMVVGIPAKNKEFDNQYRDMEEPKDS
ncbi:pol protein [Colletotrichum asianum]|uniref:Pol protein n=2 Tax=Colletotrichum asianum TaxID=702518 RepID=A0A8H3ZWF1_9PEZI|nr:pol protein [Colletotrichum asianum]